MTLSRLPLALFRQLALLILDLDLLLTQLSRVDARLVEQLRQEVLAVSVVERRLEAIDLDAGNLPSLRTQHKNAVSLVLLIFLIIQYFFYVFLLLLFLLNKQIV